MKNNFQKIVNDLEEADSIKATSLISDKEIKKNNGF